MSNHALAVRIFGMTIEFKSRSRDLALDSGQRQLTSSKPNPCASSRSVYLSGGLSHRDELERGLCNLPNREILCWSREISAFCFLKNGYQHWNIRSDYRKRKKSYEKAPLFSTSENSVYILYMQISRAIIRL